MKSIPVSIIAILFAGLTGFIFPVNVFAQQPAATVQSVSGTCMLNRGESAETLTFNAALSTGDIVTCTERSDATVVYANDCAVSMPAESQLTIGSPNAPCDVLTAALIIPGAAAAAATSNAALAALAAGFAAVPIIAVVDSTIKNNSEDNMSGE